METIKNILEKKTLSHLGGNIALVSDQGSLYINGKEGTISSQVFDVSSTIELGMDEWVDVLGRSGNLGMLIVKGKARVKGDIGLAFKLVELVG